MPLHYVEENKKFYTLLEEDEKDDSRPQLNLKLETLNTINQFENREEESENSSCVINLGAPAIKESVNMHNLIVPYTMPSPNQKNTSSPH